MKFILDLDRVDPSKGEKKTPRLVFPGEWYIFFRIATQSCAISKFYDKLEHARVASRADIEYG